MEKQTKKLIYEYLSKNNLLNIDEVKKILLCLGYGYDRLSLDEILEKIASISDTHDTILDYLDSNIIYNLINLDNLLEKLGHSMDMTRIKIVKILNEKIQIYINDYELTRRVFDYFYFNNLLEINKISNNFMNSDYVECEVMYKKIIHIYYKTDIIQFITSIFNDGYIDFDKAKNLFGNEISETIDTLINKLTSLLIPKPIVNTEKKNNDNPLEYQIAGDHYSKQKIQPIEYILANKLGFCEGNVVKYVTRYSSKNGMEDLKKAKHYLEFLIKDEEEKNKN